MAQNLYETMFVLKPTLTPEETQARINFVKEKESQYVEKIQDLERIKEEI